MSVRAYKIIEIKTESEPTFNCWHDDRVRELANMDMYNGDGGILDFCVEDVQEALDEEKAKPEAEQDKDFLEHLEAIIKDAGDDEWVQYYCY